MTQSNTPQANAHVHPAFAGILNHITAAGPASLQPRAAVAVQHTPGPWRSSEGGGMVTTRDLAMVCVIRDGAAKKANARLIAAAPDLFSALRASLPQLRWADIHGSRCPELIAQVEAAIAKATK